VCSCVFFFVCFWGGFVVCGGGVGGGGGLFVPSLLFSISRVGYYISYPLC